MDFMIAGSVRIAAPAMKTWRKEKLDPSPFEWLDELPMFDGKAEPSEATVGSWMDSVAAPESDREGESFVIDRIRPDRTIEFLGLVDEDTLEEWHQDLAASIMTAGLHGGRGEAVIFSPDAGVCFQISVDMKSSICLPGQKTFARLFEEQKPRFMKLQQLMAAKAQVPDLDVRSYLDRLD